MATTRILFFVSIICSLFSCGRQISKCEDIQPLYGDSSINRFVLRDTSCFESINTMPKMIDDPNIGEFIGFSNASSTEYVLMARENGGLENQFDYFYLIDNIAPEYAQRIVPLPDSTFVTTLGAHIGCSEKEFLEKYRNIVFDISQSPTGNTYEYQDTTNQYRSIYKFNHGNLSQVEFGYVW